MDDKSITYNIQLCRICLNPKKLDLISTSNTSESKDGKSCWETLKYIFREIIWIEDHSTSLVCKTCLKKVYETAEFKKLCLESNRQREQFNNKYKELVNQLIPNDTDTYENEATHVETKPTVQIEEVILPPNEVFIKTEEVDDFDVPTKQDEYSTQGIFMISDLLIPECKDMETNMENNESLGSKGKRKLGNTSSTCGESSAKKINTRKFPNVTTVPRVKLSEILPGHKPRSNEAFPNLKSREVYDKEYQKFESWCKETNVEGISESDLLGYFEMQSKTKKISSLWSIYSMLRMCLNSYKKLDISHYTELQAFLKRLSEGYESKKSEILQVQDINRFIQQSDDRMYLATKVVLIMGYKGACRREELTNMSVDDIDYKTDVILVSVPKTKSNVPRLFSITEKLWIDLIKQYVSLRPSTITHRRFFVTYRNGYCISSPIGINTIGQMPRLIAKFLKLPHPELYTGHCFRRSSVSHLANNGGDLVTIKRHGGWKSSAVSDGYIDASLKRKIEVGQKF